MDTETGGRRTGDLSAGPGGDIPPYLEILNGEQREAVFHWGRPLLILAGAGSGKTRVITTKIAYLIRERGLDPRSILAVTFTNKAAREMADRARLIDERAGDAMMRTFHSFGAWFLRRNGTLANLDSSFVIYDEDDSVSLLSTFVEDTNRAELRRIAAGIARAKDYFFSPDSSSLDLIDHHPRFRKIYAQYEERLQAIGNVDFGDLIKKTVEILRDNGAVAGRLQDRFRVILVDEYQDANIAQFELLKELAGPAAYICVVGDDDQSIYRFRGAEVRNILEFPERFQGADIIRLPRNYRSTSAILRAAASVVARNRSRLGKELVAHREGGKKPVLSFLPDQDEEASFCASLIEASREGTAPARWSDWAVLYRTNAQSLSFETEFLHRGIPYRVVGSLKFYEREEIKDALALLSFLVNPRDEIAFRRVVNKPARGLGKATVDRIVEEALNAPEDEADRCNLEAAARRLLPEMAPKARKGMGEFLSLMEEGRALLAGTVPKGAVKQEKTKSEDSREDLRGAEGLSVLVVTLVKDSGLADYHRFHDEIGAVQRLNNLQELANAASEYSAALDGLLRFLENIELDRSLGDNPENKNGENQVTLITFHNTKGLEFRRVVMTGLEQGIFPRDNEEGEDLEEERRLFYVGATRAIDELYLTSCAWRRLYGRTQSTEPSLFLREIDPSVLRVLGDAPFGFTVSPGGGRRSHNKDTETAGTGWTRGDRVYHDDYGYGGVVAVRESGEGPVVELLFESGKTLRFLSSSQGRSLTKIGKDY
ncbi:MAG: UvrD-helicase domain-containing protein [Treponema sp.]|jgi:DNA helicase-2/ATP-dependent DNA helicase PcrA|nr:UvrD-helicase domain-containing protein [Treponema sp.]